MPRLSSAPVVRTTLLAALLAAGLVASLDAQQPPTATPASPSPLVPGTPAANPAGQPPRTETGVPTTTGAAAKAPGAPVPTPAPEDPNRIQFNLNFPKDQGGGSAAGSAASLEYVRETYAVLAGNVKVKYQDIDLSADRAEIDLGTKIVKATGHVIVDQGPRRMSGDTLEFDLETKTGTLSNATAQVQPDYYFTGREISKTGDDTYEVVDGVFSSCSQKTPDWSFKLGRAEVQVEGYAHIHHATFRAKKLPLLYTPYILWPAKRERTSGLLIPNIGYSVTHGALLGLAYYQVLGRSYDTTFHFDDYSKKFYGVGDEFRYNPTEGTFGTFLGYAIHDPDLQKWRWKLELNHITTDLPFDMRGVISYQKASDFDYYRDFERDLSRNTIRSIYSRGFITGNWGPHLLNFLVDDRATFVNLGTTTNDEIVQRKLPELEYRLRSTELGKSPFYLQFRGALDYLDVGRPQSYAGRYGRVDLFPELTLPIRTFPWLALSVTGGERLTWYGDKLDTLGQKFTGQSLTRTLPEASAELVGPSFTRIFDGFGSWSKIKHVIEPRFSYSYEGTVDSPQTIPLFDEVDFQSASNLGTIALDNRILAKPKDEKESAREVLLFEISRSYSFDRNQPLQQGTITPPTETEPSPQPVTTQQGPFDALVRFNPTRTTSLKAEASYDTLFKHLAATSLSGNVTLGPQTFGLTWFTRYATGTGDKQSDQIGLSGGLEILPGRLHLDTQINYDVVNRVLQLQRYIARWSSQCWGFQLELSDYRTGLGPFALRTKDYRFSISLKNVGTFLDLTGRTQAGQ
ncbi:MAG TPA: LPS assembly protein LptD [Thermoanaerobaculia bacterium]|nr:LPS assembly protein LptD [Thermoanaerobaculia bacterium]